MGDFDYGYGMAERFARDTAQHQMTVLHDDGLYRHLRFQACWWQPPLAKQQASSFYWFDLVTVPGVLIFKGDGQSFVFSRIKDMFEFFRGPVGQINPVYWSEKLTSTRDGQEGVKVYSEDLFRRRVVEAFVENARSRGYRSTSGRIIPGGVPRGTGKALREQVLAEEDGLLGFESEARRLLDEFEHDGFRFFDTWEWDFRHWDWWFLWACHAIVWGIACYDAGAAVPGPSLARPVETATVSEALL